MIPRGHARRRRLPRARHPGGDRGRRRGHHRLPLRPRAQHRRRAERWPSDRASPSGRAWTMPARSSRGPGRGLGADLVRRAAGRVAYQPSSTAPSLQMICRDGIARPDARIKGDDLALPQHALEGGRRVSSLTWCSIPSASIRARSCSPPLALRSPPPADAAAGHARRAHGPRRCRNTARYGRRVISPSRCSRPSVLPTVGWRDAQPLGDLDRARLAFGLDQLGDQLDVVLGDFLAARTPGLPEAYGLLRRCWMRRRSARHDGELRSSAIPRRLCDMLDADACQSESIAYDCSLCYIIRAQAQDLARAGSYAGRTEMRHARSAPSRDARSSVAGSWRPQARCSAGAAPGGPAPAAGRAAAVHALRHAAAGLSLPHRSGRAPEPHAMSTVGEVDHARNGFDPHEILTDWDTGDGLDPAGRPAAARVRVTAVDQEVEIAPGVFFPAWSYNGRVPGPTLRATEGDLVRIRFANAGSMPHTMHFHGIHSARMDGVPGAGEVCPGETFVYEFEAKPVRLPPLSLPLAAAEAAHPQRALRRLHHRPRPRAPSGAREVARSRLLGTPENAAWQEFVMVMNGFDTNFDEENEFYAVNTIPHAYAKRPIRIERAPPGARLPGQPDRVRPDQLVPSARQLLRLLRLTARRSTPTLRTIDTVMQCQAQRGILEFTFAGPRARPLHVPCPPDASSSSSAG